MRRLAPAVAACALLACACSASALASWNLLDPVPTRADATNFLATVARQVIANRYAVAWQTLYPAHQIVAPLDEYVTCEQKSPIPGRIDRLEPIRAWWAPVKVAGETGLVRGVRVTFLLRLVDPVSGGTATLRPTFAAVWIGWRWAWMLPQARYDMYVANTC